MAHRRRLPTEEDSALARTSGTVLAHYASANRPLRIRVTEQEQTIELPPGAVALLIEILQAMASGKDVTIIAQNAELTTVQAAEILNVSRPFLIKLLENGTIPYYKIGTHRRVRMEDVIYYKEAIDRERETVLDQLVEEARNLDMGY
ncbi:MAG: DNA-binding protein [Chloroflexi bacterium]|nr:DNA-binding protein [Chloroflexota bacterium]